MAEQRNKEKNSAVVARTALWVLVLCLFSSTATSIIMLRTQEGFGASDFPAVFTWTLFFSIGVALSAAVAIPLTSNLPVAIKLVFFAMFGVFLAISVTLATAFAVGPWIGAFSIPLLPSWLVGVVSGLFGGELYFRTRSTLLTGALSSSATVLLILAALLADAEFLQMDPVTVITVQWEPGNGPTTVQDDPPVILLTEEETANLVSLDLGGTFIVKGKSTTGGVGDTRRVVLVMHQQVNKTKELLLPRQGSVIYVQLREEWLTIPPNAPTATNTFRLTPSLTDNGTEVTTLWLDVPGGTSGTSVFTWP